MLLLLAILPAVIVGLIAGGNFRNLASAPLHGIWLPVAAFIVQESALFAARRLPEHAGSWMWATTCIFYALLLIFIFLNRKRRLTCLLLASGTLANFLVIAANGFKMPVSPQILSIPSYLQSASFGKELPDYFIASDGARLFALGDVIYFPIPQFECFISAGDILVAAGAFVLIISMMTGKPGKPVARRSSVSAG